MRSQKIISVIEDLVKKAGQKKLEVSEDSLLNEAVSLIYKTYKKELEYFRYNKKTANDLALQGV